MQAADTVWSSDGKVAKGQTSIHVVQKKVCKSVWALATQRERERERETECVRERKTERESLQGKEKERERERERLNRCSSV